MTVDPKVKELRNIFYCKTNIKINEESSPDDWEKYAEWVETYRVQEINDDLFELSREMRQRIWLAEDVLHMATPMKEIELKWPKVD